MVVEKLDMNVIRHGAIEKIRQDASKLTKEVIHTSSRPETAKAINKGIKIDTKA
ncbi:MAG: hypothetical protein JW807_12420 [Spirochaetes bacterium]|nr:hypothetical protein [Spirochaetota bacterium]